MNASSSVWQLGGGAAKLDSGARYVNGHVVKASSHKSKACGRSHGIRIRSEKNSDHFQDAKPNLRKEKTN